MKDFLETSEGIKKLEEYVTPQIPPYKREDFESKRKAILENLNILKEYTIEELKQYYDSQI